MKLVKIHVPTTFVKELLLNNTITTRLSSLIFYARGMLCHITVANVTLPKSALRTVRIFAVQMKMLQIHVPSTCVKELLLTTTITTWLSSLIFYARGLLCHITVANVTLPKSALRTVRIFAVQMKMLQIHVPSTCVKELLLATTITTRLSSLIFYARGLLCHITVANVSLPKAVLRTVRIFAVQIEMVHIHVP